MAAYTKYAVKHAPHSLASSRFQASSRLARFDHCCLQVRADPTEHHELSKLYPERVFAMKRRIEELKETAFTPVRCGPECDDGYATATTHYLEIEAKCLTKASCRCAVLATLHVAP